MPERAPTGARARRWATRAAAVALALAAWVVGANVYLVRAASDAVTARDGAAPARDAVLVLGNFVLPDGSPSPELEARLETARDLYLAGRAPRIIATGLARGGYNEPRAMAAWLEAHGVPAAAISIDPRGRRTAASMANAAAAGVRSIVIATQGYHLPRSLYLARHAGIDAVGVAAPTAERSTFERARVWLRETIARSEVVVEVAIRGVRA